MTLHRPQAPKPWARALATLLLALASWSAPAHAQFTAPSAVVTTPQVRAELMAHAPDGVQAGAPIWVGLQLQHQPHWHTYWQNPGDSGLPTQLSWRLPAGVSAGPIAWPVPRQLPVGTLTNYGYEDTVLLAVPLTLAPNFQTSALNGTLRIALQASWLVCRQECIPQQGDFTLDLPVRGATAAHAADFAAARAALAKPLPAQGSQLRVQGDALELRISGLPAAWHKQPLTVFPEEADILSTDAPRQQGWQDGVWRAVLPLASTRQSEPQQLHFVLTQGGQGWRVSLPVQGRWPPTDSGNSTELSPALQAALQANAEQGPAAANTATPATASPLSLGFGLALLGALVGGLILNLMPCVFPVLAIKVLGFARHADDHRSHRLSGMAYTAGVITSFMALGLLLLGLRAAGASLGWGFQLQNPFVVCALAGLFTLIALNLAGVFEFGQLAPSSWAAFQARHPVLDAFVTGVLAVAVASPCSAPFMGASLGLAVTLPNAQALLIFATLGLGLALPYLLASLIPAFARALPRPGAWMDVLRKLLAFPMWATVVWLVWVLGQQSGINGAATLLALLVTLSAVLWSLSLPAPLRRWIAPVFIVLFAFMARAGAPLIAEMPANQTTSASAAGTPATRWQPWSEAAQAQALAAGQTVLVDFTAAWCVTCQINKQTTLADERVLSALDAQHVVTLRADWTRRDAAISAALSALGRNGVPVYALHRPGQPPQILSELLRVDELLAALNAEPSRP